LPSQPRAQKDAESAAKHGLAIGVDGVLAVWLLHIESSTAWFHVHVVRPRFDRDMTKLATHTSFGTRPGPIELSVPSPDQLFDADLDDPWLAAFHEAGHVVASISCGYFPEIVYIEDDGSGRTDGRKAFTLGVRAEAMVLHAGVVAEEFAGGCRADITSLAADGDYDKMTRLFGKVDEWALRQLFEQAGQDARKLLGRARVWQRVERLAAALVAERKLERPEIADIVLPNYLRASWIEFSAWPTLMGRPVANLVS